MQMHEELHKRVNMDYSSQNRIYISDCCWKLINKHGSCGTVPLWAKRTQCGKTKYNPKVYSNMLLVGFAAGRPILSPTSKSRFDPISNVLMVTAVLYRSQYFVAANVILRFALSIDCISFKWKLMKFTQSLISPTPRFLHKSTSGVH